MKYPKLYAKKASRQMIDTFGGYNHNLRIADSEFFDMKNMTSDHYPVLSPRQNRGVYTQQTNVTGLIAKDALCYIDGSDFVINEYCIPMGLSIGSKTLVSMGAYVIILPDKKYINTLDFSDNGNIDAEITTQSTVAFSLCTVDGAEYLAAQGPNAPSDPQNMDFWIDTACTPHTLKQWSENAGMWQSIAATYIKIMCEGIGKSFSQYDGISISGLSGNLTDSSGVPITDSSQLAALNGSAVVWSKGEDYIVVAGMLDQTVAMSNPVTIKRQMPDMDFVIESGNRLWGCKYGLTPDGEIVNEIYASKLGDFKNWKCFMNLSTDSYATSCGTDGEFTGAVSYLGFPLFFKENCVHKVYGNYPANFQIQTTPCRGVQKGCRKSLAIVNEILYYKSQSAVCAYDGSLPTEISYALGDVRYENAVAGVHGNKYYICMQDAICKEDHLFVYDAAKGLWHKEDDTRIDAFCACREELYAISGGKIITMLGSGTKDTEPVRWMVQTGEIGLSSADMKTISRLTVRMALDIGTEVSFYAQYDFCDEWELVHSTTGTSLHSFSLPIRPKRCDYMKLRIEGSGMARIYAITRTTEQGSELS